MTEKSQPEPVAKLAAGQLAGKVQRLQRELQEQVERQARLLERRRRDAACRQYAVDAGIASIIVVRHRVITRCRRELAREPHGRALAASAKRRARLAARRSNRVGSRRVSLAGEINDPEVVIAAAAIARRHEIRVRALRHLAGCREDQRQVVVRGRQRRIDCQRGSRTARRASVEPSRSELACSTDCSASTPPSDRATSAPLVGRPRLSESAERVEHACRACSARLPTAGS